MINLFPLLSLSKNESEKLNVNETSFTQKICNVLDILICITIAIGYTILLINTATYYHNIIFYFSILLMFISTGVRIMYYDKKNILLSFNTYVYYTFVFTFIIRTLVLIFIGI